MHTFFCMPPKIWQDFGLDGYNTIILPLGLDFYICIFLLNKVLSVVNFISLKPTNIY
jgi:hypothetical protein